MIAEVIINSTVKSLNKTFDYIIPDNLINSVKIGSRVTVLFGRSKKEQDAYVIDIKDNSNCATKEILNIQEGYNLSKEQIDLSLGLSKVYFCNLSDAIKLMLPPGTKANDVKKRVKKSTKRKSIFENKDIEKTNNLKLTNEQQTGFDKINKSIIENEFNEYLIYGITGSRKNRNLFAINRKCFRKRKNSNSIGARDFFNTTNGRQIFGKIWKYNLSIT